MINGECGRNSETGAREYVNIFPERKHTNGNVSKTDTDYLQ